MSDQAGSIFAVAAWCRLLTDEEVRMLSANPWALYAERQPWWRRLLRWMEVLL